MYSERVLFACAVFTLVNLVFAVFAGRLAATRIVDDGFEIVYVRIFASRKSRFSFLTTTIVIIIIIIIICTSAKT